MIGASRKPPGSPVRLALLRLDVMSDAEVTRVVEQVIERSERIDDLIDNAGSPRRAPAKGTRPQAQHVFRVLREQTREI